MTGTTVRADPKPEYPRMIPAKNETPTNRKPSSRDISRNQVTLYQAKNVDRPMASRKASAMRLYS